MEPFELRRRNIVREGTQVVTGQRLYAVGMDQTLEKCQQAMTQHLISVPSQTTKKARGTGVACIYRTVKTPTMSAAWVKMEEDGSINILMGSVEVGQGVTTIPVSYTHLRAHETKANLVCRLLLEKKKKNIKIIYQTMEECIKHKRRNKK